MSTMSAGHAAAGVDAGEGCGPLADAFGSDAAVEAAGSSLGGVAAACGAGACWDVATGLALLGAAGIGPLPCAGRGDGCEHPLSRKRQTEDRRESTSNRDVFTGFSERNRFGSILRQSTLELELGSTAGAFGTSAAGLVPPRRGLWRAAENRDPPGTPASD
jgi:hypothetical protein